MRTSTDRKKSTLMFLLRLASSRFHLKCLPQRSFYDFFFPLPASYLYVLQDPILSARGLLQPRLNASLSLSRLAFYSLRAEFNKCCCTEGREEQENIEERERAREEGRAGRINDERSGRLGW